MAKIANLANYRKNKKIHQAMDHLASMEMPQWLIDHFIDMGQYNNKIIGLNDEGPLASIDIHHANVIPALKRNDRQIWWATVQASRVFVIGLYPRFTLDPFENFNVIGIQDQSLTIADALKETTRQKFLNHVNAWLELFLPDTSIQAFPQAMGAISLFIALCHYAERVYKTIKEDNLTFIFKLDSTRAPGRNAEMVVFTFLPDMFRSTPIPI